MRNWSCIVDFNRITSIWSISELLLILISGEGFFLYKPSLSSRFVYNINGQIRGGGGVTVQHHVIWSVYLSPIIYNLQNFHLRKIILVGCFPAYNLYFHPPVVITSGISIVILINLTRIETFLSFCSPINTVSHYFLSSQWHPTQNSENFRINISTTMIGI